jgi:hypothetical protein
LQGDGEITSQHPPDTTPLGLGMPLAQIPRVVPQGGPTLGCAT